MRHKAREASAHLLPPWALVLLLALARVGAQELPANQQDPANLKGNVNTINTINNQLASSTSSSSPGDTIKTLIEAATSGLAAARSDAANSLTSQPAASLQPAPAAAVPQPLPLPAPAEQQQQQSVQQQLPDEPVIQLDYSSFNDEILRKNTANFVYFNANFEHCRNCDKFFAIWRELASDLFWWRRVVKLFAINCSDEDNIEMCRRARVTQFPQVKFYWIMSNSLETDGQRVRILGKSVHAMRHLIMDRILDSYMENVKLLASQKRQAAASGGSPGANGSGPMNPIATLLAGPIGQMMLSSSSSSPNPLAPLLQTMLGASRPPAGSGPNANGNANANALVSPASLMGGLMGAGAGGNAPGLGQMVSLLAGLGARKLAQPLPANWPKLEALEVADTQQLLAGLPLDEARQVGALLVMETQEFLYTGLEVLLDLSPYSNQTYVARVRDERSQLSKNLTKRDDINAPALIYVSPTGEARLLMTAPKYTNDEDLRRSFVRTFERKQLKYPVKRFRPATATQTATTATTSSNKLSEEDEDILNKVHLVYLNDLTNALRASLMEQVFRHPDLSDDQYNALVKYVYVLINYYPFDTDESLKFFKRLHNWLQNQVSPMDIGEYKKQFHDIDEVLPKRDWIACKSLSSTKSIPARPKKGGFILENPGQIGKVVSNITRLLRSQQQQAGKFKNLFNVFAQNLSPVMLNNRQVNNTETNKQPSASGSTRPAKPAGTQQQQLQQTSSPNSNGEEDSPLERIVKSLTSGSLGSDSSILKLISTALGGAGGRNEATGKSKFAREYPCGAWKLAHVMVVNEYVKDSPRKDVKHIVLHSLYQYMLHFYACATCGNRVTDVATEFRLNLDDHLQEQSDSVMLLWKVHNRISKRLESELRPGSPSKSQFPSETLCSKCRPAAGSRNQQAPGAGSDFASTPNWHEKQVLNFLVHHYRPQSLLTNSNSTGDSGWSSSWIGGSPSSAASSPLPAGLSLLACLLLASLLSLSRR